MVNRLTSSLVAVLVLLPVLSSAQEAAARVPPALTQSSQYRVGPSDVLKIRTYEEPGLSGDFNVDGDGTITFPFLSRVEVKGKTLREVEETLTNRLKNEGFVNKPQVSVEIGSFRSRAIYVMGEVRAPGKYTIEGQATLLEVIAKAGSFTTAAGPTLKLLRFRDGQAAALAAAPAQPNSPDAAELFSVDIEDLKNGRFTANALLQDGDTINVPAAERFYVSGFVRTPGSFVLRPGMTVQQGIAEAGGITERGSTRGLKVIRRVNGKDVETDIKMSDQIKPGDTIKIRQRLI